MFIIREESSNDIERIFEINYMAFGEDTEARLVNRLRDADELILSLVALSGDTPAGHIAFTDISILPDNRSIKACGLGPMAVLPEYQNSGYGSRLTEEGFKILAERGYDFVAVLGNPGYYPRFGFKQADTFGIYCEFECPPEAFMIKELKKGSLIGVHGTVYYSPVFKET